MRLFVLNLGNTTLSGGIFSGTRLISKFRIPSDLPTRRLAAGIAARLRRPPDLAVLCSVVPSLTPRVAGTLRRSTGAGPLVLDALSDHGLSIGYGRPGELGADRVAAALGARTLFPGRNLVVVDCGTATTVTALDSAGRIHGGAIMPGVALWSEMLARRTAQLPLVTGQRSPRAVGRSPSEAIASGIHHGHVGAISHLIDRIAREAFGVRPYQILGTGGNAPRFRREKLFTRLEPDLILHGLRAFAARIHDHV